MAKRLAGAISSSHTTYTPNGPKFAVNTVTSSAVISFLEELFSKWVLPAKIITDNGKQFVLRQMEDFFKSLGIEHARTALYHPQANRAVERFNRFLTDQL